MFKNSHKIPLSPKGLHIKIMLLGIVGLIFGCTISGRYPPAKIPADDFCTQQREKARSFIYERRYEKALEILDDPSAPCRGSKENLLMEGDIYYTLEDWDRAERAYKSVLNIEPRNPTAVTQLWFIQAVMRGFNDPVKQKLKQRALSYLEEDPQDPNVLYAVVLGLDGARAVQEKTRVIERYARFITKPEWHEHVAAVYFYDTLKIDKEDIPPRTRFFMKTFPSNPYRYHMAHFLLSSAIEKGAEAVHREAREILKKEPDNRILNYLCAKAIVDSEGDLTLAESYMKKAIKAAQNPDPEDRYKYVDDKTWAKLMATTRAEYHALMGKVLYLQGNMDIAEKEFEKGLSDEPRSYSLRLWFGKYLEDTGRLDAALSQYKAAASIKNSEEATKGMGRILYSKGIESDPAQYFADREGVPRFTDVTEQAGLEGIKGRRAAWSDIDGNGFPDLVVSGRYILLNNGNRTFTDVTADSGVNHRHASGGILADFDKNGTPDLFAFTSRNGPKLYLNRYEPRKSLVFEDMTESGLPPWPDNGWRTEAAAVADVNGDGTEDIYIANYEKSAPERALCAPDRLYMNKGDGAFEDGSIHLINLSRENMCGRGVSFSDFNGDGRQDLFVANYRLDPDFLFVNIPGAEINSFELRDQAESLGVRGLNVRGAYGHSIGGAWGYLCEERPALFVAALAHPRLLGVSDTSALYLPTADTPGFERHFEDLGFLYHETHSDPSFVDVDLDGDLDLFITSIYTDSPSFLYFNKGGKFEEAAWLAGVRVENSWGSAWADYDKDGDLDLLVCTNKAPRLFRNEAQALGMNWLEIKVNGTQSPTTGIGAKVTVQTVNAEKTWVREIHAGRGTGNQDEALAHFGLGKYPGPFTVTVKYTSGKETRLQDVSPCQVLKVTEP